jgi:hypothetical protein
MSINWSVEQLQEAIDEIISGERLVEIQTKTKETIVVLFKYPARSDIRISDLKMKQTVQMAINKYNLMTEEQMLKVIEEKNIWTERDKEIVEELKEKIDKWKGKLKNPDLTPTMQITAAEAIKSFEEKIFEAEYKKEVMLANTADRKGRQEKYEYLAWCSSYNIETGERIWSNYLTYCSIMDTTLKNNLLSEFIRYLSGKKTEEVRYIARSNLWRISYVIAQKTNTPLFPRAVVDLTPDQTNLAWWTGYYDGIWQMMPEDIPDEATIEDDEALDSYMESLHKERSKERQDAKKDKKNPFGVKSARHMKEQLMMRANPDYFDSVYDSIPTSKSTHEGTDLSLKDEATPGTKAALKRAKEVAGSRRYVKEKNEEQ